MAGRSRIGAWSGWVEVVLCECLRVRSSEGGAMIRVCTYVSLDNGGLMESTEFIFSPKYKSPGV